MEKWKKDIVKQLGIANATPKEILEARRNVSIRDFSVLERWMEETRPFIVFNSKDLMQAMQDHWPDAYRDLQCIVHAYHVYRSSIPSGDVKTVLDPITNQPVEQPQYKSEVPTLAEWDRCTRWAIQQIKEQMPEWTLDSPPL